jgi:hypothetical protein
MAYQFPTPVGEPGDCAWKIVLLNALSAPVGVTIRPASGSVPPGGVQFVEVHVSPVPPPNVPPAFTIEIDSNVGSQRATYQCSSTN